MDFIGQTKKRAVCYNCGGEIVLIEWSDGLPSEWCHEKDLVTFCPTTRVAVPKQETIVDA